MSDTMHYSGPDSQPELVTPAPEWFRWALLQPVSSHRVEVQGCPIHYLLWPGDGDEANRNGLLFVHGGGAHANWWRFIAPFFNANFRVAAIDLSGMGDSGAREEYDAAIRAEEIRGVLRAAGLGTRPYVVGHSFGGAMTIRFGASYGDEIGGAVIVDSPIRRPEQRQAPRRGLPPMERRIVYSDYRDALGRFRLRPPQICENVFIIEHIARHSLLATEDGWTWKFHPAAMSSNGSGEPFHEHLRSLSCRAALIFGEDSALVDRDMVSYMSELMGPYAPVIGIPEAQHHVMLDQPLAFVTALRALLEGWVRADRAET